jgi:hypothetical protein
MRVEVATEEAERGVAWRVALMVRVARVVASMAAPDWQGAVRAVAARAEVGAVVGAATALRAVVAVSH